MRQTLTKPMSNSRPWIVVLIIMNALLLAATASLLFSQLGPVAEPRMVTPRGDLGGDERATIDLFRNARESVVFISTRQRVADFWTRNVYSVPRGSGSGLVWDGAGHIVTNFHVIEGASQAQIQLADGRQFSATLVGVSPQHDLAVLKIGGAGFTAPARVPIGTSSDLQVGQNVFAIGNPFGLDWTLTKGIVSALDRSLPNENGPDIRHLIQTDAAINPGNSGGPLLDSAGRLIGINTAIYSPSGASAGIGFAVPVDTVMRVVPQLISEGRYTRPSLGLESDDNINDRLKRASGIEGVFVLRVDPGSVAERAGLVAAQRTRRGVVPGDIVTAMNGKPVSRVGDLLARLDDFRVGQSVELTLMRGGEVRTVRLELEPGS
ncbi:trypsin-like peptidase domain-containing protein [Pelagerythrobacter marinus]|uniref:PDZ domain-containing protein n=2 Tax=Erythrobacteraceae TaxID=335929 RepID=A0A418NIN6_9SPHN|nr:MULTISPECIES: trypsin-like peptidase domain-containing protein [Pelagerythrobacter]RIV79171.1 PDZ domain-containing protein [Pelagerythrobacter aerophilus]WPZ07604.1 trypsin-like peptidase domain-containing protein [Pelagerythrobacter marinus]